jgi:hypothetical protein
LDIDGIDTAIKIIGYDMPTLGKDGIMRCGLLLTFAEDSITKKVAEERLKEQIIGIFQLG